MTNVPPRHRHYTPRDPGRRKDVDQAARVILIKKLTWALPGGVIGALAGWFVGFGVIPGFLVGGLFVYLLTSAIERSAASLFGKIYNPSGGATPRRQEYSYAESLKARGQYERAIEAYEVALSEFPEDPEPYVRIARIYRDQLCRFDEALFWFKRARSDAIVDARRNVAIAREIIELHVNKLGQPERAIPELARLVDQFAGEEVGEWARGEIARIKGSLDEGGR